MAGRCGLEDYARRCVRCRVPKHADSSSAAELDARLSLPVPNEMTLRARAREERCARVMHQRFPVVNSCQRPQIVAAPISTLRLARMETESTKSENRHRQHRHAVIKKTRFFFFLFLSGFGKRFFAEERTFAKTTSSRHFSSAQHDTHQLTPCRFSSRLVRPSPVFPSRTPCNLRFTSTAARPPPASRSTFPRRIVASSTTRQLRPLAHSRLARRPRATAR